MRQKLKFKKLLNEFRSLEYEYEYNSEVLRDFGESFECVYMKWCEENNVDIDSLRQSNSKKVLTQQPTKQTEGDDSTYVPKKKQSKHRDVFKSIAKKIHPDKLANEDPRKNEFNEDFIKANSALNKGEWGGLFDVIDKYEIDIEDYEEANQSLEKDIGRMEAKLKSQKSTYAWHLQNCGEDLVCQDIVIQAYLKQVYGWDGIKGS